MASLGICYESLGRFYIGVCRKARGRLADIVGKVNYKYNRSLYKGGKVHGVNVPYRLKQILVILPVLAVFVRLYVMRPAVYAVLYHSSLVAQGGNESANQAYLIAIKAAGCKSLCPALARAVNYQVFAVPLRLGHAHVHGAAKAQIHGAKEICIPVVGLFKPIAGILFLKLLKPFLRAVAVQPESVEVYGQRRQTPRRNKSGYSAPRRHAEG